MCFPEVSLHVFQILQVHNSNYLCMDIFQHLLQLEHQTLMYLMYMYMSLLRCSRRSLTFILCCWWFVQKKGMISRYLQSTYVFSIDSEIYMHHFSL
jgi:hypothetical protein